MTLSQLLLAMEMVREYIVHFWGGATSSNKLHQDGKEKVETSLLKQKINNCKSLV